MELRSQEVRTLAPENDPLKMGMGWKVTLRRQFLYREILSEPGF